MVSLAPPDHYSVPQAAGLDRKGCDFPARCVRGRVCHRPRTWIQREPILWIWLLFRGRGPSALDQGDFPCVLRARIVICYGYVEGQVSSSRVREGAARPWQFA